MSDGVLDDAALRAERRRGRLAGAGGIAALLCTVAAIVVTGHATRRVAGGGELSRQLRSLQESYATHQLALGIRVAGLVLAAAFGLFLARAVCDRLPEAPGRALRAFAIAGPACVAAGLAAGLAGLHAVSGDFAALSGAGEKTAEHLVQHDTTMRIVAVGELAAHVVFGVWVSLLCLWAMRAGLLSRFLAVWGFGAGLGGVLLPVGDALFLSWLGSAAILALGWWPEGRPPAWDAGRAVSWSEVDAARAGEWRADAPTR